MKLMTKQIISALALATAVNGAANAAWYDDVTFKGDFRYRYQFDQDDTKKTATSSADVDRSRNRMRFRYGAYGKINDSMDFGFRLTTGGDGSVDSTNQTLKSDFGNYSISLDQVYAKIKTTDSTTLTFGKMSNPFWTPQKSQLIWDGDVTPEGIAGTYKNGAFFANLAHFFLDSESRGSTSSVGGVEVYTPGSTQELTVLQVGLKKGGFAGALAYYSSSSDPATAGTKANLLTGAEFLNLGLEYNFKIGSAKAAVYGNYAVNQDESNAANVDEDAFQIGLNVKNGAWKAGLAYLDVGNEAVSGFQDSDFNGKDSDSKGYKINAAYGFAKNASAGLAYYSWEDEQSVAGATDRAQSTLQAELKFKF